MLMTLAEEVATLFMGRPGYGALKLVRDPHHRGWPGATHGKRRHSMAFGTKKTEHIGRADPD